MLFRDTGIHPLRVIRTLNQFLQLVYDGVFPLCRDVLACLANTHSLFPFPEFCEEVLLGVRAAVDRPQWPEDGFVEGVLDWLELLLGDKNMGVMAPELIEIAHFLILRDSSTYDGLRAAGIIDIFLRIIDDCRQSEIFVIFPEMIRFIHCVMLGDGDPASLNVKLANQIPFADYAIHGAITAATRRPAPPVSRLSLP
jgi:hypothetical protein